jgi:Protein of unknown function (DUF3592)
LRLRACRPQLKRDSLGGSHVFKLYFEVTIGVTLALGGLAGLLVSVRDLFRAFASRDWPSVSGQILEASITRDLAVSAMTYAPRVRYRYTAGGTEHTGETIGFGGAFGTSFRWVAQDTMQRYHPGDPVEVRICPADVQLSVLQPGPHWYTYASVLLGAAVAFMGIAASGAALGWPLFGWLPIR